MASSSSNSNNSGPSESSFEQQIAGNPSNDQVHSGANIANGHGEMGISQGIGAGQGMLPGNIGKEAMPNFGGNLNQAGALHAITADSALGGNILDHAERIAPINGIGSALSGIDKIDGVGSGMGLGQMTGLPHHDLNTLKGGSDREQS